MFIRNIIIVNPLAFLISSTIPIDLKFNFSKTSPLSPPLCPTAFFSVSLQASVFLAAFSLLPFPHFSLPSSAPLPLSAASAYLSLALAL